MAGAALVQEEGQTPVEGQTPEAKPPTTPAVEAPQEEDFQLPKIQATASELYSQGMTAFNKGQWKLASEKFQTLIEKHKDWKVDGPSPEQSKSTARATYYLGIAELRQNNYSEAATHLETYTAVAENTFRRDVALNEYADALYNLAGKATGEQREKQFTQALALYTASKATTGAATQLKDECSIMMAACNTELAEMAEKRGDSTKSAEFAAAAEKLYDGLIPNEGEFQAEAKKQRPNVAIRRAKAITARLISNATAAGTEADASERAKLLASVTADLTQLTKVAQASGSDTLKKFATAQYQAVADLGYKAETAGAIDNAEALYRTAGEAGKADLAWLTYSKRGKHAEAAAQFGEFIKAGTAPADMQKAYANCHTVLAKAAFAAGKYAEADTHLTALAKTTSDRAFGVHGLMVSGVQQEKWSQVIEHATAILKDPALKEKFGTTAQLNLVRAQNASGNIKAAFESAIKYRSELEEANQDSSLAKMLIAETYVAQGDKLLAGGKTEEARAMFVSATSETLYPDSEIAVEAKIKIAQTYAETDATKQQELLRDVAKAIPVYIELRQKAGGETARFAELLQQANTISNPKQ